jgi:hypothetical protein
MEYVLSSDDEYYSKRMTEFIDSECKLPRNQWIYKIIDNDLEDTDECVFLDCAAWCLCLDKHRCARCRVVPRGTVRAAAPPRRAAAPPRRAAAH